MKGQRCIVVVSKNGYRAEYEGLLREWVEEGIAPFCALGKDCEVWEEAMDNVCVKLDVTGEMPGAFCMTTSHPNETLDEVLQFASNWNQHEGAQCDVEVKEI